MQKPAQNLPKPATETGMATAMAMAMARAMAISKDSMMDRQHGEKPQVSCPLVGIPPELYRIVFENIYSHFVATSNDAEAQVAQVALALTCKTMYIEYMAYMKAENMKLPILKFSDGNRMNTIGGVWYVWETSKEKNGQRKWLGMSARRFHREYLEGRNLALVCCVWRLEALPI